MSKIPGKRMSSLEAAGVIQSSSTTNASVSNSSLQARKKQLPPRITNSTLKKAATTNSKKMNTPLTSSLVVSERNAKKPASKTSKSDILSSLPLEKNTIKKSANSSNTLPASAPSRVTDRASTSSTKTKPKSIAVPLSRQAYEELKVEVTQLKSALSTAEKDLAEKDSTVDNLHVELKKLKQQMDSQALSMKNNETLKTKTLQEQEHISENEIQTLRLELSQMKKSFDKERNSMIETSCNDIEKLQNENFTLKAQLLCQEEKFQMSEKSITEMKESHQNLITALKDQLSHKHLENLEKWKSEHLEERNQHKMQLDINMKAKLEIESLQKDLKQLQESFSIKLKYYRDSLDMSSEQIQTLEVELSTEKNTHIERLLLVKEENSATIKLLRDTHDRDMSDLMRRLTVEYESKLATEKDQVLKLRNENSDLTKEICRMKNLVLDMKKSKEQAKARLEAQEYINTEKIRISELPLEKNNIRSTPMDETFGSNALPFDKNLGVPLLQLQRLAVAENERREPQGSESSSMQNNKCVTSQLQKIIEQHQQELIVLQKQFHDLLDMKDKELTDLFYKIKSRNGILPLNIDTRVEYDVESKCLDTDSKKTEVRLRDQASLILNLQSYNGDLKEENKLMLKLIHQLQGEFTTFD